MSGHHHALVYYVVRGDKGREAGGAQEAFQEGRKDRVFFFICAPTFFLGATGGQRSTRTKWPALPDFRTVGYQAELHK